MSAQTDRTVSNTLVQEIERLRRDLSDVQRYVYRDDDTAVPPSRPAPQAEPDSSARLQRQILEIQGQIREVTGHIERVQHDVRVMGDRLDKLVADVDIRLRALESGQPLGSAAQPSAANGQTSVTRTREEGGTTVISSGGVAGVNTQLAPGQRSLGQVSGRDLAAVGSGQTAATAAAQARTPVARAPVPANPPTPRAAPAPGGVLTSVASVARPLASGELPEGTVRQQYEYAFGKLKTRNYDDAENALRAFVDRHPDDPLAGNAMYWMGETYYVRKQYSEAARIFLDAYQRFPKGNKAPDNLFKLAKSLSQIGEDQSACTTYAELVKTFPSANQRILSGARSDMTRLGCG
ncbi:MAG: tol-pal system protein YbgF [Rhodospirillaceae bacterium]|nr:tol-pal system protein YbgF [Rhodospirillaceae bacterium]